ncbi:ROK family protein [Bacillus sp. NEB1478]|uniref:ROK family protein n=1 Tax=Bacillus sp. NEB1478 TaxID=3073816 RepID=UPI002873BEE1|nr:ROK family protein [Bacillus sp. NEB1478]WNB92708.1 ROK family protein [Bacillus sp. NEB1478]
MKKKYILAADVGGTKIECVLFNIDGELLNSKTFKTNEVIKFDVADCLAVEMKRIIQEQGIRLNEVSYVGLGVTGLVDSAAGVVLEAPSLNWENYPMQEKLQNLLGIPVCIGNDVNIGLLGEVEKGTLEGVNHAIYFMIGTSIGAGLFLNGEIYEGHSFSAGEVGYAITEKSVVSKGFRAARPGYGYLSTHAGGYGMAHKYAELMGLSVSTEELFQLAKSDDPVAKSIIEEAVEHISTCLINLTVILNPEVILFSGGVGSQLKPFLEKINENLDKYVPFKPELNISSLGNHSVLYGAYSLCRKRLDV